MKLISNIVIRPIEQQEMPNALKLVVDTFMEFEIPFYSNEGILEFINSVNDNNWLSARLFYGAFIKNEIIGVIAVKNNNHISLLFVDKSYQRQGVGKQLTEYVLKQTAMPFYTVNAAPQAKNFYEKIGFKCVEKLRVVNGIEFYPMQKKIITLFVRQSQMMLNNG